MPATADIYAVIGNPVAHSRSPRIHGLFAEQVGANLVYERLLAPVDGFDQALDAFFARGGKGLNVTVPFKLDACRRAAAHLSARAQAAGAVNTLWRQDGALHGCNTDGVGLLRDLLRLGVRLENARVLLVGAGGAARGALGPLLAAHCAHVRVVNRTASRAHDLVQAFAETAGDTRLDAAGNDGAAIAQGWDVVINATASGLFDAAPELPHALYADGALAYDMVYASAPTPFMQQAGQQGARTADGLGMLVEQAAESFHIWRGVLPHTEPVLAVLRAELDADASHHVASPEAGQAESR